MPVQFFHDNPGSSAFTISPEDAAQIPVVMEMIESFQSRELSNEAFDEICKHCWWLISKIPLPMHWMDSSFIVRSRENMNGEIFSEQWQVSYHTRDLDKIAAGRFNRPTEPMFYGALKGNDHKGDNVPTATLESCKRILDPEDNSPFYDFTLGKWLIKEHFHVINLLYHEETMTNNPHIAKYLDDFFGAWDEKFSKDVNNHVRHFILFFSSLAASPKPTINNYFISNAFWATVREYYKRFDNTDMLGIAYPSWITEFNGVNIVLTPNAVDTYLNLEAVGMYRYARDRNNPKIFQCGPLFEDLVKVIDGCFTIPQ